MSKGTQLISAVVLVSCISPSFGQSFNVDVGTALSTEPGFGAPSSAHGGAANQPGVWNNITGTDTGPFALVSLNGSATGVTLTRSTGTGGNFGFNNINTTGDFQLLLDDGHDLGSLASPAVTYTFSNLAQGTYDVYSYAVGPDSATFVTSVNIGGLAQNVGGAIPVNAYAQGVTHAIHAGIELGAVGALTISFDIVTGAGTTNGLQLVYTTPPVGVCIDWHAGPFFGTANTNGIGDYLTCVRTWDPDGQGPQPQVLVVGGDFSPGTGTIGGVATYNAFTNTWQQIGSMHSSRLPSVLGNYNNELIVGGDFNYIDSQQMCHIGRWNGSSWQGFGPTCPTDQQHGPVYSLIEFDGALIVGEKDPDYYLPNVTLVWRWTANESWQDMSAGDMDVNSETGDSVRAFWSYNGELFAGGNLPGPSSRMRWTPGVGWTSMNPGATSTMYALQGYNGQLIAGGHPNAILQWNGSTWTELGGGIQGGQFSGTVNAFAVYGGELIVAGRFATAGGSLEVNNIARWNGSMWQTLGSGIICTYPYGAVDGLAVYNGQLYAVGDFHTAGGVAANNIARWDGNVWSPVLIGNSMNNVFAIETSASRVVVAGDFQQTTASGEPAKNIVRYDGAVTSKFGTGMNGAVTALKSRTYPGALGDATELTAGGLFTNAGGVSANYIARWNEDPFIVFPPPAWAPMGAGFNSGVYAIERFLDRTIAAGAFTASGGTTVNRIARWNEVSDVWQPMGSGMNSAVRAVKGVVTAFGNGLAAGGDFTTAGGVSANRIAFWNDFDSVWSPMGPGFNGSVHAIEYHNFAWYAGGAFTASGATTLNRLAFYVPFQNSWFPVGNGIGFNGTVKALKSVGNLLYAAGQFTSVDGISANHIAVWNGTSWAAVQGGANDWVLALGLFHNEIHAGGLFTTVDTGAITSPGWAIYQQIGVPWIVSQPLSATIDCNQNVDFNVTPASGYEPLTYSWRKGGTPLTDGPTGNGSTIAGAQTALLLVNAAREADAGSYNCVVSNSCGNVTSSTATLAVSTCCIGDITGNQLIDIDDLVMVITNWGASGGPADINFDGVVNIDDLVAVVTHWGSCP